MPGVLLDRTKGGLRRLACNRSVMSFGIAAAATVAETLREHCGARRRRPAGIDRTSPPGRLDDIAPNPAGAGMFRRHHAQAMALHHPGRPRGAIQ